MLPSSSCVGLLLYWIFLCVLVTVIHLMTLLKLLIILGFPMSLGKQQLEIWKSTLKINMLKMLKSCNLPFLLL
jgi:hypothetical protein